MRSLIIIYECRLDPEYENVYAMSNNYNNEMVVGINYSLISDRAQDSRLTSCNQFESPGGRGTLGGKFVLGRSFLTVRERRRTIVTRFVCKTEPWLTDVR